MLNQRYRLYAVKQFRIDIIDEVIGENDLVVRPEYLSVCEADKRYYTGSRGQQVMAKKLPMALIHEGVGRVIYDPRGEYEKGTRVVMLPNEAYEEDPIIKENYLRSSKFHSSACDGFMQEVVVLSRKHVIPFHNVDPQVAVLSEIMSCIYNAIEHFEKDSHPRRNSIGIWGPGNMGFVTALILKKRYPDTRVVLFGLDYDSMGYFPFVDEKHLVSDIPENLMVDHAFECVGGPGAGNVINQIIDHINPQGTINLIGVSNDPVPINTRMVLEKGLNILGNSRSSYQNFRDSVDLLENNPDVCRYLQTIISNIIEVRSVADMNRAFDFSISHPFKTVMKWEV
ncbi:MAG: zinc-binding dehydrogenase [Erysipelotrichaceae bacterium]|nr:zinc-binding dehydrogenase [Erysipelotrichaceae bacterium]MBR5049419.1 zinc-binding dehydrogenase [Erysipelotrichaceae bacterium]